MLPEEKQTRGSLQADGNNLTCENHKAFTVEKQDGEKEE
jgi:hypothetical protein